MVWSFPCCILVATSHVGNINGNSKAEAATDRKDPWVIMAFKNSMTSTFVTPFFDKNLPNDVFPRGLNASVVVIACIAGALQALALHPYCLYADLSYAELKFKLSSSRLGCTPESTVALVTAWSPRCPSSCQQGRCQSPRSDRKTKAPLPG